MKRILSLLLFSIGAAVFLPLGCDAPTPCDKHEDCEADEACIFGTHLCASKCNSDADCGANQGCSQCGTTACPECDDQCIAVCITVSTGAGGPGGW